MPGPIIKGLTVIDGWENSSLCLEGEIEPADSNIINSKRTSNRYRGDIISEPVNRQTLASIQGCLNEDALAGTCCTNRCQYRATCNIKRIKLTIPTITLTTKKTELRAEQSEGTYGISILTTSINPDEYLNEHSGMHTSEKDTFLTMKRNMNGDNMWTQIK